MKNTGLHDILDELRDKESLHVEIGWHPNGYAYSIYRINRRDTEPCYASSERYYNYRGMLRSGNCKSNELSGLIKMKTLLWVDDARNPMEDDWMNFSPIGRNCKVIWAQSYQEAIDFLEKEWPDAICLDHDLGEEKSGYDIAKYIVDKCIDKGYILPQFASQSANPVGRENILSLFKNYEKFYSTCCL